MPMERDYFPQGAFEGGYPDRDRFIQDWYGGHLRTMLEPRLFGYCSDSLTVYRFLCLPTFDNPYVIRISRSCGCIRLTTKRTDGAGGYDPGKIVAQHTATLAPSQWARLERAISGTRFWSMPTSEFASGYDGTRYVVEGYDRNHYHVVDRWSPSGGAYLNLCNRFVELRDEAAAPSAL